MTLTNHMANLDTGAAADLLPRPDTKDQATLTGLSAEERELVVALLADYQTLSCTKALAMLKEAGM